MKINKIYYKKKLNYRLYNFKKIYNNNKIQCKIFKIYNKIKLKIKLY